MARLPTHALRKLPKIIHHHQYTTQMAQHSPELPSKMRAIKIHSTTATLNPNVALPSVSRNPQTHLLARVETIALNPTDWKHIAGARAGDQGCTSGCDFAGTIVSLPQAPSASSSSSSSAWSTRLKSGDRIASTVHGANFSNAQDGCFAEFVACNAALAMRLPASVSLEQGATLPLGVATVGQGLFQKGLGLRVPSLSSTLGGRGGERERETVLIYGGSTATGSLGIQFANLAGYRVLTTCGKTNEEFVRRLGAEGVYDYREEGVGERIRKETGGKLKLVWDCIGLPESMAICAKALSESDEGCRYATITPSIKELEGRPGVQCTATLMYTIFGEEFEKMGHRYPASQEDFEFAKMFFALTEKLLEEGKLQTHPEEVRPDGLEGALKGLKDMKDGKISAKKLVYRVTETPTDSRAEIQF